MSTTKKVFENSTAKDLRMEELFAGIKVFPKRKEGHYQVNITGIETVGTEKIYFKINGKFTDNNETFQDLKPLFATGTLDTLSQSMEILIRELTTAYFPGQDFSERPLEIFEKLIDQTVTVRLSFNNEYKNYNYLPNVEDVEQIEL